MKFYSSVTAFTAFVTLVHALPAALPVELTAEDIIKLSQGIPVPNSGIEKRAVCHADNLLRRFRDNRYSSSASGFCSCFIESTNTGTASVRATVTTGTTQTLPPSFVTVTDVSLLTETDTFTSTLYIPSTVVPIPDLVKRGDSCATTYPPWLAASYPPSRVSSACSCYITARPVAHTTKTIVVGTTTVFSRTITLPPVVSTVTESTTTVTTITSTVTSDPKVINCGISPACRSSEFLGDSTNEPTRKQCLERCLNTEGCKSIQYGNGSVEGICFLSSYSVAGTYAPGVSSTSPVCLSWVMDDVECVYLD